MNGGDSFSAVQAERTADNLIRLPSLGAYLVQRFERMAPVDGSTSHSNSHEWATISPSTTATEVQLLSVSADGG